MHSIKPHYNNPNVEKNGEMKKKKKIKKKKA